MIIRFAGIVLVACVAVLSNPLAQMQIFTPDDPYLDDPFFPQPAPSPTPTPVPAPPAPPVGIASVSLRLESPMLPTVSNTLAPSFDAATFSAAQIRSSTGSDLFAQTAEPLFQGLASMRPAIASMIRSILLSIADKIRRVDHVTVAMRPLAVTLRKSASGVMADISGIKATVSGRADDKDIPIFCPSVDFVAEISINGSGLFNIAGPATENIAFSMDLNVLSASCSGAFGSIVNLLAPLMRGETVVQIAQRKMSEELAKITDFTNLPDMFSLALLRQSVIARLPAGTLKTKTNVALDLLLSPASGSSPILTLELFPDRHGPSLHEVVYRTEMPRANTLFEMIGAGLFQLTVSGGGSSLYTLYRNGFSGPQIVADLDWQSPVINLSGSAGTQFWLVTRGPSGIVSTPKRVGTISGGADESCTMSFRRGECREVF